MTSIHTLVPGRQSVELVAYYPQFSQYYPECELQTKRWFVEHAHSDWTFFDVGANIGYYSILFSQLAPAGYVYAFEPTDTIHLLRENIEHHACKNVKIEKLALGRVSGSFNENIYRIWGEKPDYDTYDFSTIDEVVNRLGLTRLDCIKIDVDGFDFEVLQGAEATLRNLNPWVIVELNHVALSKRGQHPNQALEWLVSQGYTHAHVTDLANYVLKRASQDGAEGLESVEAIALSFEARAVPIPPKFRKGKPIDALFDAGPMKHNLAEVQRIPTGSATASTITVPGPRWSYAASWAKKPNAVGGAYVIELDVEVSGAAVGFGCTSADDSDYVGKEIFVKPNDGSQTISLFVDDASLVGQLVLRNADSVGAPSIVNITEIRTYLGLPNP